MASSASGGGHANHGYFPAVRLFELEGRFQGVFVRRIEHRGDALPANALRLWVNGQFSKILRIRDMLNADNDLQGHRPSLLSQDRFSNSHFLHLLSTTGGQQFNNIE